MTTLLKSKNTSIFFSALVAFALMTGQPYSSIASEEFGLRDEMVGDVYAPHGKGAPSPLPKGEYKGEPRQYTSKDFELRDEMVGDVYAPHGKGAPSPLPKGEYKGEPRQYTSKDFELRNEIVNHVYMPLGMGDPSLWLD